MKTELKAKYLQYLNQKKQDEGFTLIELLVVIIIIGILAAIALPSFLNQANKARASEAKTYTGSMNRAQQAYILENPEFVTDQADIPKLGLGIKTQTENYTYKVGKLQDVGVTNKAQPTTETGKPAILKGYVGSVVIAKTQAAGGGAAGGAANGEATSIAILCETVDPITKDDTASMVDAVPDGKPPTNVTCADKVQKQIR